MDVAGAQPASRSVAGPGAGRRRYTVVGAGISGLWAAVLLARRGEEVLVLERTHEAGGLAGREVFRGLPCDLGSHRLHGEALRRGLFAEFDREHPLAERPRRGRLVVRGRHVPYPPSAAGMLGALGPRAGAAVAVGAVREALSGRMARRRGGAVAAGDGDVGFERFVRARVGDAAYEAFYRPYAEKVWGLPAHALSQSVARLRVSTVRPWALLRAPASYRYPRQGLASVIDWLTTRLDALGVEVRHGVRWTPEEPRGEAVLHAGAVSDLVDTALAHRGLYLVYLALPVSRLSDSETFYIPDRACWAGRVSELQHYAPALRRPGETVVCVEIPEGAHGPGLDFSRGDRLEAVVEQLRAVRVLPRGVAPLEAKQRFVPGVYPLYLRGWRDEWERTMSRIVALGDVFPFGRQGLFLHCNLDHCAEIAEAAVRHVVAGGDPAAWIGQARSFLGLRVRD